MTQSRLLFLDSCSVLNLYASNHFEWLLASLDGVAVIVDLVMNESLFIRTRLEDGQEGKELIQLDAVFDSGLIVLAELDSEIEFELYLELALRLDEGEAATLALAASRGGTLVTDDRKALSIAGDLSVPSVTTPDVLHQWAEQSSVPISTLSESLERIRWRARFEPNKRHPLWSWWRAAINAGETP